MVNVLNRFSKFQELLSLDARAVEEFEKFAARIHDIGIDWYFADDTVCWGRRDPGAQAARIRLGRVLLVRDEPFVMVAVEGNGREVILERHPGLLKKHGHQLGDERRYRIPMDTVGGLLAGVDGAEFEQTLKELAGEVNRRGCWPDDTESFPPDEDAGDGLQSVFPDVQGALPGSTYQRLTWVRKGHSQFRRGVVHHWRGECAVRGAVDRRLLIASHIVPWCESTKHEKTDWHNGLLLSAPLDALFDIGLISFADDGQLVSRLDDTTSRAFGIGEGSLAIRERERITDAMKAYLARHREAHGFTG